jgi:hypothetical protein
MNKFMKALGIDPQYYAVSHSNLGGKKGPLVLLDKKKTDFATTMVKLKSHLPADANFHEGHVVIQGQDGKIRVGVHAVEDKENKLQILHEHLDKMGLSALKTKIKDNGAVLYVETTPEEVAAVQKSPVAAAVAKATQSEEVPAKVYTDAAALEKDFGVLTQGMNGSLSMQIEKGATVLSTKNRSHLHDLLKKIGHGHLVGQEEQEGSGWVLRWALTMVGQVLRC